MDLTFESLVRVYVYEPNYIERPWLIQAVETALADPACRFVLLVAPPGAGKTAFAAGLAARRPDWIRYFLRRDQRSPLSDAGAVTFLLHIGYQLAALHPELFTLDTLRSAVEQRIGSETWGGEVVGAEVDRILASPFYRMAYKIRQQVERNAGRVIGLQVSEPVVDTRLMGVSDLQYSALLDAALIYSAINPDQRLVVLIDALDELRFHYSQQTLLDWLSHCPELPSNLRFVLTSRPDDLLLGVFRGRQKPRLRELTIDSRSSEVRNDVYLYAAGRAAQESIERVLVDKGMQLETFLQAVAASAAGNLGYVAALFNEIQAAIAARDDRRLALLLQLKVLPSGLENLYAFFLRQIKVSVDPVGIELKDSDTGETYFGAAWPTVYYRILGALAVAMEPLDLELIERLGGIQAERAWVSEALERLAQLLMQSGNRYSLYHETLADFLTSARTREQPECADLYVDPISWHSRICSTILAKVGL